jgi:2-(1,2-epoxy-1,2-dihydrophenyl)acetyl-CoA isomerase
MGVKIERDAAAAIVVLDWPESRNSMGPDECNELAAALKQASADQEVHGVVLTGNGAFCSGGNLKGASDRSSMPEEERRRLVYGAYQGMMRALLNVPVPTVAAVDGAAVGMGFDIALACDSRFIGAKGWCMQGWGRVGLVPGTGGELLLRMRAPNLLWRLLETQERLDAAAMEKLAIGESSGDKSARERAVERINKLAPMSREALEGYVALHRAELRERMEPHLALAVDRQLKLLASPDFKRRAAAALGKG